MIAASGLATARQPHPELVAEAVNSALNAAGVEQAEQVILFLSSHFAHDAGAAVRMASRVASCITISGSTASGIFTEKGWVLDQPAAAAMVIASLHQADRGASPAPILTFCGSSRLPSAWQDDQARIGFIDPEAINWAQSRLAGRNRCVETTIPGAEITIAHSHGLRALGTAQEVETCDAHDLRRIGGGTAIESLTRVLPAELREHPPLHLVQILRNPETPPLSILGCNASDGSLLLSDKVCRGEKLSWAIRQPLASEADMRSALSCAVRSGANPAFALMFSCMGRGPMFYGDDDRDLRAFLDIFPHTPLLGAYGTGQILPLASGNRMLQQAVLTLLFKDQDAF